MSRLVLLFACIIVATPAAAAIYGSDLSALTARM